MSHSYEEDHSMLTAYLQAYMVYQFPRISTESPPRSAYPRHRRVGSRSERAGWANFQDVCQHQLPGWWQHRPARTLAHAEGATHANLGHGAHASASMHHSRIRPHQASLAGWSGGALRPPAGEREGASGPARTLMQCAIMRHHCGRSHMPTV